MVFQITILISGLAFDGSTLNRIANSVLNPHPQWLLSPTAAAKDKTERKWHPNTMQGGLKGKQRVQESPKYSKKLSKIIPKNSQIIIQIIQTRGLLRYALRFHEEKKPVLILGV
jgi:hypothetical protein